MKKPQKKSSQKSQKQTKDSLNLREPRRAKSESLSLSFSKVLIEKIVLFVVLILLGIFFVRIAIWEHNYYTEMEGKPRATAETVSSDSGELDETPVTEEQIREHIVPADHPRYLSIQKLGIKNARILSEGLKSNGELDTPVGIFDVGWYSSSGTPGSGRPILLDGHNGGPNVVGVFKYLNQLYSGDTFTIERGDGEIFTYEVVENKEVPLSESDDYMGTALSSPLPGRESVTLISCTGEWSQTQNTYLSRQFVRAVIKD
ncbi:class F sortase [Candidatus Saccharibacteria bacterium]|nr:class F sortase [Candidatus Saccharibacteria bacterium]